MFCKNLRVCSNLFLRLAVFCGIKLVVMKMNQIQGIGWSKVLMVMGLVVFGWMTTVAQSTTVWIVRHGEKDTAMATRANPDLNAEGKQRAMDLATYLQKENIAQILSTDTKRTVQTAAHIKAPLELYNPRSIQMVVEKIKSTWKGKTILLVGHSNTVLETIDAMGGNRPVPLLNDEDYDYIFKVVIDDTGKATATVYQFGKPHRGGTSTMQ